VFRAEVIGSMLRPAYLKEARAAFQHGRRTPADFKLVEDRAVDQVIAVQEGAGVDVVSDGEMRRYLFMGPITETVDGIEPVEQGNAMPWATAEGELDWVGMWMASGGYDYIATAFFERATAFDAYFLEYDDARSGTFEPLSKAPNDKQVVLGLVSTKKPDMETPDELKARIDEAARLFPREQMGLLTQCGFASVRRATRSTSTPRSRSCASWRTSPTRPGARPRSSPSPAAPRGRRRPPAARGRLGDARTRARRRAGRRPPSGRP
jgi:methionine synthase II (cobalamin-independent)